LELCDNLIWDREDLVRKGVSWALKDIMRGDRKRVLEYVKGLRRKGVSAVITLYAIRGLREEEQKEFLKIEPYVNTLNWKRTRVIVNSGCT
jgi:3-methyladenine DNA glycosylase AlkD